LVAEGSVGLTAVVVVVRRDIINIYGLDAFIFLRSLRLQATIIFAACIWGLCFILPVNSMGTAVQTSATDATEQPWGVEYTTRNIDLERKFL
jgi:uncharacterized membrane protein YeiB